MKSGAWRTVAPARSATLGMTRIVPMLRDLEKQGASGTLTNAAQLCEKAAREFKLIQNFLAALPARRRRRPFPTHEKNSHHRRRPDCGERLPQQARRGRLSDRDCAGRRERFEDHAHASTRPHRARPHAAQDVGRGRHPRSPQRVGIFQTAHHGFFQHLPDQHGAAGVEGRRQQMPFQGQLLAQGSGGRGAQHHWPRRRDAGDAPG